MVTLENNSTIASFCAPPLDICWARLVYREITDSRSSSAVQQFACQVKKESSRQSFPRSCRSEVRKRASSPHVPAIFGQGLTQLAPLSATGRAVSNRCALCY